ncbi:MAG: DoxX family membrane protein [bacterium]
MNEINCSQPKNCAFQCPCTWSAETWAMIFIRLFLGLRLLTAGLAKFAVAAGGYSFQHYHNEFAAKQIENFASQTFLPKLLLAPYLHGFGYAEVLIGLALILGLRTRCAFLAASLLLVSIGFGMMLLPTEQSAQVVVNTGVYLGFALAGLLLCRHDKMSLWSCRCEEQAD